jgi:hypothetical protein
LDEGVVLSIKGTAHPSDWPRNQTNAGAFLEANSKTGKFLSICTLITFTSSTAYILCILIIFYAAHSRRSFDRDKTR